jgi:hypothetical protein
MDTMRNRFSISAMFPKRITFSDFFLDFGDSCSLFQIDMEFEPVRMRIRPHLAYPATRYELAPITDLSDRAERERLSGAGLAAFFAIMQRWKIRDEDARRLLGTTPNGGFYEVTPVDFPRSGRFT